MTLRIAVINSKGGTSKSATAINLAGYFARQDKEVTVIDCDKNRSALRWLQQREEGGVAELFKVISQAQALTMARTPEVVIYDTAAQITPQEIKDLAAGCDLVLVTTLASRDSILPTLDTVATIEGQRTPYRIVITQTQPRTSDEEAWRDELLESGYNLAATSVRFSVHVHRASANGLTVMEMGSRERRAGLDFKALGEEIEQLLTTEVQKNG